MCMYPREYINIHTQIRVYQKIGVTLQRVLLVTVLQPCINFVARKKITSCNCIAE